MSAAPYCPDCEMLPEGSVYLAELVLGPMMAI